MILVVGSAHDDVLYLENLLRNKQESTIFGRAKLATGVVFDQEVGLIWGVYSDYLSTLYISYVMELYPVILIIYLGRGRTYHKDLHLGDICIAENIHLIDVDFADRENTKIGEVPSLPSVFQSDINLTNIVKNVAANLDIQKVYTTTFLSSNKVYTKKSDLDKYNANAVFFGERTKIVLTTEVGGSALMAFVHNIPFIGINVIEGGLDEDIGIDNYLQVLKTYAIVGKILRGLIGEISRKDISQRSHEE